MNSAMQKACTHRTKVLARKGYKKWVLKFRLKVFRRRQNYRLCQMSLEVWRERSHECMSLGVTSVSISKQVCVCVCMLYVCVLCVCTSVLVSGYQCSCTCMHFVPYHSPYWCTHIDEYNTHNRSTYVRMYTICPGMFDCRTGSTGCSTVLSCCIQRILISPLLLYLKPFNLPHLPYINTITSLLKEYPINLPNSLIHHIC